MATTKVEIAGACEGLPLEKRTYLPGVTIRSQCPKCGAPWTMDLGKRHLSYPVVGKPEDACGYCSACEHEWPVMVVVRLSLEVAP